MNNNTKRKDWVGGSAAVFKTLGASNHKGETTVKWFN